MLTLQVLCALLRSSALLKVDAQNLSTVAKISARLSPGAAAAAARNKGSSSVPLHSCYANCSALLSLFEDFCGGAVLSV